MNISKLKLNSNKNMEIYYIYLLKFLLESVFFYILFSKMQSWNHKYYHYFYSFKQNTIELVLILLELDTIISIIIKFLRNKNTNQKNKYIFFILIMNTVLMVIFSNTVKIVWKMKRDIPNVIKSYDKTIESDDTYIYPYEIAHYNPKGKTTYAYLYYVVIDGEKYLISKKMAVSLGCEEITHEIYVDSYTMFLQGDYNITYPPNSRFVINIEKITRGSWHNFY